MRTRNFLLQLLKKFEKKIIQKNCIYQYNKVNKILYQSKLRRSIL